MRFVFRAGEMIKASAIAAIWLCIFHIAAWGQTKTDGTPNALPPEVAIHIEAHPQTATVGDPIRLDMDITIPMGYQVEVSKPVAKTGDFFVMDFTSRLTAPKPGDTGGPARPAPSQSDSQTHHRTQITIAVFRVGKFSFPAIPLKIKTAEGKEISATSPPVEIEIRSVITEKNPNLRDLKKQAEIPEPVHWIRWIIAALLLCAAGAIAWYLWRHRRKHPAPLTPAQTQSLLDIAEADLRDLIARGLPVAGREKQFYVALSEIVKRILEAGYGIHTAERTTSEIMDSLRKRPDPGAENREQIESFLTRCDVVKFAKYIPSPAEHEEASRDALQILHEVREKVAMRQSTKD